MINERIKSLKGSLETCENMLATGVLNEYSTALYKIEITCIEDELRWLEQLKELGYGRIQVLETSYSSSKNDEYMNAKLLGEVRGIKFMLGETTDTNYNHYSCNPEGHCDCCSPVHVDYEKEEKNE